MAAASAPSTCRAFINDVSGSSADWAWSAEKTSSARSSWPTRGSSRFSSTASCRSVRRRRPIASSKPTHHWARSSSILPWTHERAGRSGGQLEHSPRRHQLWSLGAKPGLLGSPDELPAGLTLEDRVTAALVRPGECGERLHVVGIGEQALLRQLDHPVDVIEATMQLHEDVAEDVLLFPAAAAHGVKISDPQSHESYGRFEIAADDRQLALEQSDAQGRPVAAGTPSGHLAQPLDLLLGPGPVSGFRERHAEPVVHPPGLPLRVLAENSLAFLREVSPGGRIRRRAAQHLETPEELDALVQRQWRCRGRPVVPGHAIVAEKRLGLRQVPEEMRVTLERGRSLGW